MPGDVIGTIALMLAAGFVARLAADLLRLPPMLLLLGAGALLGPDLLGWLDAPLQAAGVQVLFTLGVAFILFHGALGLSAALLGRVALGLALLVVPGVVLTAGVVAVAATAAFGVDPLTGFLIGAVLAPTDPAILIPLFDRLRVRRKVAQTIVAESALNDVTGAVLALAVATAVVNEETSLGDPVVEFLADVGVSTVVGLAFGVVLSLVVSSSRIGAWREAAAIAVVAVVAASWVSIDFAGGSGYIGAFLTGLVVANVERLGLVMRPQEREEVRFTAALAADVVVLLVFITLGANLPFGAIADELLPALAVVATLVLVARPLAVLACLLPDRRAGWSRNELAFVAWTRETGVVPAALAGLLIATGVPGADRIQVVVALALVATLVVQATTKAWLARRLGLLEAPSPPTAGRRL
ncbi:MAG: cation:proton antiporter [Thermoleophilia bacterium]|nr:cation:proton antiporter [Thermoleophilia bacterium]